MNPRHARRPTRALRLGALASALVLQGCAARSAAPRATAPTPATSPAPPCAEEEFGSADASFALDRGELQARGASPKLLAKLSSSPYAYFRALARAYELKTCAEFRDQRWQLPVMAIHGDAHVEQFVLTPDTAGLEDFDQSGYGPAVVDLVRYAASVHLACRTAAFACDADRVISAYFAAYRSALDHEPTRSEPSIVARLRRETPADPLSWLRWAEGLLQPLSREEEARVLRGWHDFQVREAELHPERGPTFYDVVRLGSFEMGIGSALEKKFLFRLHGPTDAPDDDLVVEARTPTPVSGKSCAWRPLHGGALQPLMFATLLGPRLAEVFGFATLGGEGTPEFWLHSWVAGYRELDLEDLGSEIELVELAEDAARQLAGHFWKRFPKPLRPIQRQAQLRAFDATESHAKDLARAFADETQAAWERFRKAPAQ